MTTSATLAWISTLTDNGVRADLANLAGDGQLSYTDALRILTDAGADGLFTTAEFRDLQTVASHLNNGVAASSYVAGIFSQLVLGNPANASWTGGHSIGMPLGNLSAYSGVYQLNELIGKWFLGTDLPDPTVMANLVNGGGLPHYAATPGALYGHTGAPAVVDVAQGAIGDCVVCTGLIEMVSNHPDLLKSMIVDNGNGTYGVRFYLDGNEVWVTVDNELPVNSYGDLVYAHNGELHDQALWAPLLEKAYVQLSASGKVGHPAVNGYANIDGNYSSIVLPAMNNLDVTYYRTTDSDWYADKDALVRALAAHRDVVLETAKSGAETHNSDGLTELVASHAFAVLGYDEATGKFIVRNPWGDSYPHQDWSAQFELSMEQMAAEGGAVAVAASSTLPTVVAAGSSHELGLSATVAVAPLFSLFNPDALVVSRYLLHAAGDGRLMLNGAANLATAEQQAAGDVVIAAADLARLQFAAPAADGAATLSIQALLGQQWSSATDIGWHFAGDNADAVVLPQAHNTVAAGGSIAIASLFQLDGAGSGTTFYEVVLPDGAAGALELNGARNLWLAPSAGQYEFSAADLARVSYRAPYASTTVTLQVNAYHGQGWGTMQDVTIAVGQQDVAHAMQNYANGQFAAIAAVSDSAANIFGRLDDLQTLLRGGWLDTVRVNDTTPQVQTLTGAQYGQHRGVLTALDGNWSMKVTGATADDAAVLAGAPAAHLTSLTVAASAASVAANLDALQSLAAAGKLTAITVTDSAVSQLTITSTQAARDADALRLITGNYQLTMGADLATVLATDASATKSTVYDVADSAANIGAGLDALQQLATAGKLGTVTLTDGGDAAITIGAARLYDHAQALSRLSGHYTLVVTDASVADVVAQGASHPNARFVVSDSAAELTAQLSVLQTQAAQGKLTSVTLTDPGTPVLHLASDDLVADAAVLRTITSPYTVSVPGLSEGVARFLIQQDGGARVAGALLRPLANGAAHTAHDVVGFQNASLGDGYHAVVLDGARDHYALRSDASGSVTIKNVATGDADFGKQVTITGADYVVFNGAADAADGIYPAMYFLVDGHNAGLAELYVGALGRLPDLAGLEWWEDQLAAGARLTDVATGFIGSGEFKTRYPTAAAPSDHGGAGDQAFVNALYQNVLHRAPDAGGLAYWVNALANGGSRADMLVSFALSAEDENNTHAAPGHADGWLIDTAKGGYADTGLLLDAATVLRQGLANGYLNTGLIAPASIGTGVSAGAETLAGDTLTLGASLAPQSVVLSGAVAHVIVNADHQQIYGGDHATVDVHGTADGVHLSGAARVDLLNGVDTVVTGFVPASGATLHLSAATTAGAPSLIDASTTRVAGAALDFAAGHGYVIAVGSLGDGSATAAAAAINHAYGVAGTPAEHATFIGKDASGNTQAWLFGAASGAADHNGNHLVDSTELVHLATLVGVAPAQIGAADLA